MAFDYINEAFKSLDLLEEEMFNTSLNGINELSKFMNDTQDDEIVRVIDREADTEEDLKDSYVGKVIVNCNVCHSHIFENKEDIEIDAEGVVNIDTQCPYCGEQEGFTIVGEIAPFNAESDTNDEQEEASEVTSDDVIDTELVTDDADETVEEALTESIPPVVGAMAAAAASGAGARIVDKIFGEEIEEELSNREKLQRAYPELNFNRANDLDENKSLNMSRATRRASENSELTEDFKEVMITTEDQHMEMTSDENGKVTITTEPVEPAVTTEETIVPVSDETQNEIINNNTDVEEPSMEETEEPLDDETVDMEFDDVDEEGLDELGESYLRRVYENVESFKTSSVSANSKALIVEGVITFTSGAKKNTGFVFEAIDTNARGQLRFIGSNKHLTEAKNAFTMIGCVDNKKLFVESLKYNYTVNDQSVRGRVRRK